MKMDKDAQILTYRPKGVIFLVMVGRVFPPKRGQHDALQPVFGAPANRLNRLINVKQ